jgi:hypothetical protein
MKLTKTTNTPPVSDSKIVYITCHLISALYSLACVAGFLWLSFTLKSGWVLLGLALTMKSYRHDFNQIKIRKYKTPTIPENPYA